MTKNVQMLVFLKTIRNVFYGKSIRDFIPMRCYYSEYTIFIFKSAGLTKTRNRNTEENNNEISEDNTILNTTD